MEEFAQFKLLSVSNNVQWSQEEHWVTHTPTIVGGLYVMRTANKNGQIIYAFEGDLRQSERIGAINLGV